MKKNKMTYKKVSNCEVKTYRGGKKQEDKEKPRKSKPPTVATVP